MKSDDIDDDQLDAFLRGEDGLALRLQTLAQPEPSAQLDAAILARAQAAQETGGRAAANDPAFPAWRQGSRRWRIPAGLAAVVLAGVMTHRTWEDTGGLERIDAPARAAVQNQRPAVRLPSGQYEAPASAAATVGQSGPPPQARPAPRAQASEQVVEIELDRPSANAPPAAEVAVSQPPPPLSADVRRARSSEAHVGLAKSAPVVLPAPAPASASASAPTPAPAPMAARSPEVWLGGIRQLLDDGADDAALAEWDAFRAAHPDYPVDPELAAAIAATVSARRTP